MALLLQAVSYYFMTPSPHFPTLQFDYHVTCSVIALKPGSDSISSVKQSNYSTYIILLHTIKGHIYTPVCIVVHVYKVIYMYSIGFPIETISRKKVVQIYVLIHVLLMHCMWPIQAVSEVYLQYSSARRAIRKAWPTYYLRTRAMQWQKRAYGTKIQTFNNLINLGDISKYAIFAIVNNTYLLYMTGMVDIGCTNRYAFIVFLLI